MELTDPKNKDIRYYPGLSIQQLHKQLLYAKLEKWETITIRADNEIYYLYCKFENGGYRCIIVNRFITNSGATSPWTRFSWHKKYYENRIFGISEIANIYFDIVKINKLMIFR